MGKKLDTPRDGSKIKFIEDKLISPEKPQRIDLDKIDYGIMGRYSLRRKNISKEILETFPELEFVMNMIISSMTAPTDVITDTIVFSTENTSVLDAETRISLLKEFKNEITKYYKIENEIFNIIKTAMVTDGAYCELIIPEAMIDKIMFTTNSANLESDEQVIENISPLKNDFTIDDNDDITKYLTEYIDSTDNPAVMHLGEMKVDLNLENDEPLIEGMNEKKKKKTLDAIFKEGIVEEDKVKNLFNMSDNLRRSNGRPFRMTIPVESVTPISYKHNTKKHLGYVITLDENFMPISERNYKTTSGIKKDDDGEDKISNALVLTQSIIRKARDNAYKNVEKEPMIEELGDIASDIIDNKLKTLVVGNKFKDIVDSDMLNDVYLVMLNRALRKQKTKILFVPKEYFWYVALDYRDNGTGKTVLEELGNISSLRALLRHSRVFANLRSTIPLEKYDIKIDDDIKDVDKVIAKARNFINRNRSMTMPNGLITSTDVTDWIHNSGIVINFDHKDIPKFDIEKSVMDMDIKIPDEEIDEELRKATYMKMGINPEIIESALSNADFAGTINTQNLMYARDNIRRQRPVNSALDEFKILVSEHDYTIRDKLFSIIESRSKVLLKRLTPELKRYLKEEGYTGDTLKEYFYDEFISITSMRLPKIENFDDSGLDKQFEYRYDNIDKTIELFLSSDAIVEELSGEIGAKAEEIKPAIKAALLREWMSENNYMPELLTMFAKTDDGVQSTPLDDMRVFIDNVKEAFIKFKENTQKDVAKTDMKLEELDDFSLDEEEPEEDNDMTEEGSDEAENDNDEETTEEPEEEPTEEEPEEDETEEPDEDKSEE